MPSSVKVIDSERLLDCDFGFQKVEEPMISGTEFILRIEEYQNLLSSRILQANIFWKKLVSDPHSVSDSIYQGLCIENYHLLFRESYFDAPILGFASSTAVRESLNEFYCEEYGHDKLLLKALESIGFDECMLFESAPLCSTMALCNALSYWSRHDPVFFLTTLGPLEGRDIDVDSFVLAAQAKGLPESFVGPIKAHAIINKESEHGLLTRKIFSNVPSIDKFDANRMLKLTHLFITIYDQFYSGIWNHYLHAGALLRPIRD